MDASTVVEQALGVLVDQLGDQVCAATAEREGSRLIAAAPWLVSRVESLLDGRASTPAPPSVWENIRQGHRRLPMLLREVRPPTGDQSLFELLLRVVRQADHYTSASALRVLRMRVEEQNSHLNDERRAALEAVASAIHERLTLCGRLLESGLSLNFSPEAVDSLRNRCRELFEAYCHALFLALSGSPEIRKETKSDQLFDRAMTRLTTGHRNMRDAAVKSLELLLVGRKRYLVISGLLDALDTMENNLGTQNPFTALARSAGYGWSAGATISGLCDKLFERKRDTWLEWVLPEETALKSESEGPRAVLPASPERETALAFTASWKALAASDAFAGIPVELTAQLVAMGVPFAAGRGDWLVRRGRAGQGIVIVLQGDLRHSDGKLRTSPTTFGASSAFANQKTDFSVRVESEAALGVRLSDEAIQGWLLDHPRLCRYLTQNIIARIEERNKQSLLRSAGDATVDWKAASVKLDTLLTEIRQEFSAVRLFGAAEPSQRSFIVIDHDAEHLGRLGTVAAVDSRRLEQYYVIAEEQRELRFRSVERRDGDAAVRVECHMTLKETGKGEVTVPIPDTVFRKMADYRVGESLKKRRYRIKEGPNAGWSLDVYDDDTSMAEMIVAEVEALPDAEVQPPDFVRRYAEVTGRPDFRNRNLALFGKPESLFTGELEEIAKEWDAKEQRPVSR